jgi:hypothetical protein
MSTGSTKAALAQTIELTIPEDGVARVAPVITVETAAASIARTAKRLFVMFATILECLIILGILLW